MLTSYGEIIGIKIDKKGSKQRAVEKILAYEAAANEVRKEEQEALQETVIEAETCIDGTTFTDVMKEIIEGAEKKAETAKKKRKPRQKKEIAPSIKELLEYIKTEWSELGFIHYPEKEDAVFCALCANNTGRQVIKLMWTAKKISLFVRIEPAIDFAEEWQKINYALPYQCIFYHNTEETRQNIKNLMEMVLEADHIRITKKMKKLA